MTVRRVRLVPEIRFCSAAHRTATIAPRVTINLERSSSASLDLSEISVANNSGGAVGAHIN
jgi:hypothetical protein